MKCAKCDWELDRLAKACPICGTPRAKTTVDAVSRFIAYASIIGVVLMVIKQVLIG